MTDEQKAAEAADEAELEAIDARMAELNAERSALAIKRKKCWDRMLSRRRRAAA